MNQNCIILAIREILLYHECKTQANKNKKCSIPFKLYKLTNSLYLSGIRQARLRFSNIIANCQGTLFMNSGPITMVVGKDKVYTLAAKSTFQQED
jgi:hypothetical protein